MQIPAELKPFLNAQGRVTTLPAKHSKKLLLCMALVELIEPEKDFTEKQVNELFLAYVDDFALVRRTLVNLGYLERDRYGYTYRRPSAPALI